MQQDNLEMPQQTITQNQVEDIKSDQSTNEKLKIFAFGALILGVLFIMIGAYLAGKNEALQDHTQTDQVGNAETAIVATVPPDQILTPRLLFLRGLELWRYDAMNNGLTTKVSESGQAIAKFDSSEVTNLIAYAWGARTENVYTKPEAHTITLLNESTGTRESIMEVTVQAQPPDNDYKFHIRDLSFSDDGSILVMTTSDGIYLYDIATKKTTQLLSNRVRPDEITRKDLKVWAYSAPKLSPDNSSLLYSEGYYEGRAFKIMSLTNKQIITIPELNGYSSGELGWVTSDEILIHKLVEVTGANPESRLFSFNINTQRETDLGTYSGYISSVNQLDDSILFSTTNSDNKTSDSSYVAYELNTQQPHSLKKLFQIQDSADSRVKTTMYPNKFLPYGPETYIVSASEMSSENGRVTGTNYSIYLYHVNSGKLEKLIPDAQLSILD